MMELFEPLEEPDDPYNLNNKWPGELDDRVLLILGVVPAIGVGVFIGAWCWYREHRDENPYNIAECARKDALVTLFAQVGWLIAGLVWVVA